MNKKAEIDKLIESEFQKKKERDYWNHNYKARFLILDFDSNQDNIVLDENHTIKMGDNVDLERIYKTQNSNGFEKNTFFLDFKYTANTKNGENSQTAYRELEKINFFFEVFYEGEIKIKQFPLYGQIKQEGDYKSMGLYSDSKVFGGYGKRCSFGEDEIKGLIEKWQNFISIDESVNKTFKIARNRFLFSTLKNSDEDKLIDLMIAFEAFFLDVTEKSELSYKLALRVSRFLENNYDNMEVFDFIKKAYNLRSSVVHGSNTKSNEITFKGQKLSLKSVVFQLHKFMREVLALYIVKYNNITISNFIKKIDATIINNKNSLI